MRLESEHAVARLVEDALATVDPQSSDDLAAAQVRGYVVRHHHRLDEVVGRVTTPRDLEGLVVQVRATSGDLDDLGRRVRRRVTIDFSKTRLAGLP